MSQQKALFDAFAKSSATLHLSTENSNRALLALEQMFAKGKIQAQELRLQLGQAIPGAAARFQQAVLEMTKGTDLQGKSFDQLLQNGDLYTAKFLPALVQALQESSRGWEDASESLNAQLNRLSSNWFKLKTEVSNGLFNDAATQGIKFLANNLEHLVDVAGIAGGVLAGRLAGKGLQQGFGAVVGIRAATKATLEEAAATAANTAAQVANAEQRVVAAAIRAREL
jgi:tape measure domain-containing protein